MMRPNNHLFPNQIFVISRRAPTDVYTCLMNLKSKHQMPRIDSTFHVAIFLPILLIGCTTANIGNNATENKTQRLQTSVNAQVAYTNALRVAAEYGWVINSSDATARVFQATAPGSAGRWDDQVNVIVTEGVGEAGATITVRSGLGQGPNYRNVSNYLERVASVLGESS